MEWSTCGKEWGFLKPSLFWTALSWVFQMNTKLTGATNYAFLCKKLDDKNWRIKDGIQLLPDPGQWWLSCCKQRDIWFAPEASDISRQDLTAPEQVGWRGMQNDGWKRKWSHLTALWLRNIGDAGMMKFYFGWWTCVIYQRSPCKGDDLAEKSASIRYRRFQGGNN